MPLSFHESPLGPRSSRHRDEGSRTKRRGEHRRDDRKHQSRKYRDGDKYRDRNHESHRPRDQSPGHSKPPEAEKREQDKPITLSADILSQPSTNDVATFERGVEFIAFPPSPPPSPLPSNLDKTKAHEKDQNRDDSTNLNQHMIFDLSDAEAATRREKRTKNASRKAPWVTNVDWARCKNVAEMLHCEVNAFLDYISPSPVEDEVRGLVIDLVSKAITKAFPDAAVSPFGSYATKLYLPSGDIDLVVSSKKMGRSRKENTLRQLAQTVKKVGLTSKVNIIARAKVPIIKFVTTEAYGKISVDISVNQTHSIVAGRVINGFLQSWSLGLQSKGKALRSLVMITKLFLSQRGMNEVFTGGLGSYAIVCLAISFLQLHPKIRRGEIDPEENLGVLLMEFFELYGWRFNYEKVGISIRHGGGYFRKEEKGWIYPDQKRGVLLSVEDPTDPSNDISKGSYNMSRVQQTLRGAFEIMTASAYAQAGVLMSHTSENRFAGLALRRGSDLRPDMMSILSKVIGVTQETIDHRQLILDVYKNGSLHRALGVARPKSGRSVSPPAVRWSGDLVEEHGEVDMEWETDEEPEQSRKRTLSSDEEPSRYNFEKRRQPSMKRRKLQRYVHSQMVFTTDEEGEEEESGELHVRGAASIITQREKDVYEEGEYVETKSAGVTKRQGYWLSKGARRVDDGRDEEDG